MKLQCTDLVKTYGYLSAVDHVDLTLEQGKIYGLIGRNGAGKTTLLSLLTAQNPATSGEVTLDGCPVWENRSALDHLCFSRELNITPETGIGNLKVKEYLRIASIYYPHWDAAMAQQLVELFRLPVKKRLQKLSKGMLSMVTIIVAMASKAEFTFLDEPVAGLDVVARDQFYKLLLEEYSASGRTFVISTHIIEEAADVLEEVIILRDGKLLMVENVQDLLDSARYVSGKTEEVDAATNGLEIHHAESMGRSKGVTVLLKPGQVVDESRDVTVQPMSLQKVFVALCGEEAKV